MWVGTGPGIVDLAEVRTRLLTALEVRIPPYDPNLHPRERVQALDAYITRTAEIRQELEEALYWCMEAGKALKRQWDGVEGYEVALPRGGKHTKEQIEAARRTVAPKGLWEGLEEARSLAQSLHRQIRRMELDYEATSRSYTLMSGS